MYGLDTLLLLLYLRPFVHIVSQDYTISVFMSLYIACLRYFGANAIGWHQARPFYYCSALPPR